MDEKAGYLKSEDGCKLDCPTPMADGASFCCKNCPAARRYFINETNSHLWTEDRGFGSKEGCKLPRESMPPECLDYDCHKDVFLVLRVWVGKWIDIYTRSFPVYRLGELEECLAKSLRK